MHIAVDLRSLQSGSISGVENYTSNLLESLLKMDSQNTYTLFYNSFREGSAGEFHFVNSQVRKSRYPNRLLNLMLMSRVVSLEKIIGPFDCLFMPNLNQFHIGPGTKLAITVHDLSPIVTPEYYDLKRNLWHRLLNFKRSFDRANVIFAVSNHTKQDLIRVCGVSESKIKVVYPGVDHKIFHPGISEASLREVRNRYGLPGRYILFLNTIEPRKNLVNLIRAYENVNHDAHLVVCGRKGWKTGALFSAIKNSKKSAKIKYIGYVNEADKPAVIKLSRMLAYPSFYEGFGFQPLEAAACGVPTMVSQVTALPEVMKDSSLLVNPYQIDDMARAMDELLTNNELRQRLVEKGHMTARSFQWSDTARQILANLNEL